MLVRPRPIDFRTENYGESKMEDAAQKTRSRRAANWKLGAVTTVECPQCHQPKRPHFACENCGTYKGRQVIKIRRRAGRLRTTYACPCGRQDRRRRPLRAGARRHATTTSKRGSIRRTSGSRRAPE